MRRDAHLDPRPANFAPLTPLDFLRRSIEVFPGKTAVVAGARRLSYTDLGELVGRLAAGLRRSGIGRGDVVSVIAGNTPELLALHFAVPLTGAVLNAINTRLDPATVAHILAHAEARLVMADAERAPLARAALAQGGLETPLVTLDALSLAGFTEGLPPLPVSLDAVADEWQPISLNYTSGTTVTPTGVSSTALPGSLQNNLLIAPDGTAYQVTGSA
ncbi:MAG: AMP-binding protein, partial [Geminicoccaceae bacterium]|nr:AMP-binding protein [Geminicoccaceae bacterium]